MKKHHKPWAKIFDLSHTRSFVFRLWDRLTRPGVVHATLNPEGINFVRLHLVAPRKTFRGKEPHLLYINGWYVVELGPSLARLMRAFIETLHITSKPGEEIDLNQVQDIIDSVISTMTLLYRNIPDDIIHEDLAGLLYIVFAVASGKDVDTGKIVPLHEIGDRLAAPPRMDLVVAPMKENGVSQCPLNCPGCYAKNQAGMHVFKSLPTVQWKYIIDKCWSVGIPHVLFTGGEPLTRSDIVDLVAYAEQMVTGINTAGTMLSKKLAQNLFEASLDHIQITLYSHDPNIHNQMVGTKGAWKLTVDGIKNAVTAGLNVSINTPLSKKNADYAKTLQFIKGLGVEFVTCSGWIPTGAAPTLIKKGQAIEGKKLLVLLKKVVLEAIDLQMDLQFTSPGWISEEDLQSLGLSVPYCGASLANMAVLPNGAVTSCQSDLSDPEGLGNMLTDKWPKIWDHPTSKAMRKTTYYDCPLGEVK